MTKDPYRYFRIEAQELLEGLGQGLLDLEKGPDQELVRRLLRQAHTLKGASRVVKRSDIGDLTHQLEDLLSPHRESGGPVQRETIDAALGLLDQIRELLAALNAASGRETTGERALEKVTEEDEQTIRIAVRDVDALLESAFEAHTVASSLQLASEGLGRAQSDARALLSELHGSRMQPSMPRLAEEAERVADELGRVHRRIAERIERLISEVGELRSAASELRLVPAQTLMIDIDRVARDAARKLDVEVEVNCSGADTHIDAHVLAGLRKALVHIVRNSVAHGIEDRGARLTAGKPPVGQVDISIERRGHRVSICCRDDGRGLDLELVREAAIERGFVTRDAALSMDESALGQLLLRGGVSTTPTVTDVSGRGVGLDAVRHIVEALKGEVSLRSASGEGTTVEILVPISLSAMPALSVQIDDTSALVPLDSVRQTLRVSDAEISRDAEGERLVVNGVVIPFLPLRRALDRPKRDGSEMQSAVVIEAEGQLAAIGADRLGGARSIVIRGIPEHAATDAIVSSASFDDDGTPQLVLAPPALIRAASRRMFIDDEPQDEKVLPLLVIDDSLTTRMLEQSILESAGYEVDLAVSGEEALEKARRRRYGAFIVDIEMPGMNGFDFIATARSDPELRDTPAILVTSRADPQDKRRGKEVGARAYIVKSEFDQAELLDAIRRVVG